MTFVTFAKLHTIEETTNWKFKMIEEDIREKLEDGMVLNAPGVLEHLEYLGYKIDEHCRLNKTKALFIASDKVEPLFVTIYVEDKFLLPKDILDIPIPEPGVTEWDYQVGDVVEITVNKPYVKAGSRMVVGSLDNFVPSNPIGLKDPELEEGCYRWPTVGTFKLVKKAERKVTVEMSQETYESLKDSLEGAKVLKSHT